MFYAEFLSVRAKDTEDPDLAENSLQVFASSLPYLDRAKNLRSWVSFHDKYANALEIAGNLTGDEEFRLLACATLKRLLTVWTKRRMPEKWANIQSRLGIVLMDSNEWDAAGEAFKRAEEIYTNSKDPQNLVFVRCFQAMCLLEIGSTASLTNACTIGLKLMEIETKNVKYVYNTTLANTIALIAQHYLINGMRDERLDRAAAIALENVMCASKSGRRVHLEIEFNILRGMMDITNGLLEFDKNRQKIGFQTLEKARDEAKHMNNQELLRNAEMQIAAYRVFETSTGDFSLKSLGIARVSIDAAITASESQKNPSALSAIFNNITSSNLYGILASNQYGKKSKSAHFTLKTIEDLGKIGYELDAGFLERLRSEHWISETQKKQERLLSTGFVDYMVIVN